MYIFNPLMHTGNAPNKLRTLKVLPLNTMNYSQISQQCVNFHASTTKSRTLNVQ